MFLMNVWGILSISIHTLRVEGDRQEALEQQKSYCISIHTLRVEGDNFLYILNPHYILFQSTPSVWRVTLVKNI